MKVYKICVYYCIYIYGNSNITNSFCQLHILGCTNDVYTSDRTKINCLFFAGEPCFRKPGSPKKSPKKNRGNFHDVTSQFMLGLIATLLAATNHPWCCHRKNHPFPIKSTGSKYLHGWFKVTKSCCLVLVYIKMVGQWLVNILMVNILFFPHCKMGSPKNKKGFLFRFKWSTLTYPELGKWAD